MDIKLHFGTSDSLQVDLVVIPSFQKVTTNSKEDEISLDNRFWSKDQKNYFAKIKNNATFKGKIGETCHFYTDEGLPLLAVGMGTFKKHNFENIRKVVSSVYKKYLHLYKVIAIDIDGFIANKKNAESISPLCEALRLSSYSYDRYLSKKAQSKLAQVYLATTIKKTFKKACENALKNSINLCEAINFSRDLVNCPPNELHSENYAKIIEKDAKNLKGVKVKVLKKADLVKEKMGMFLAVNAGSAFGPRLVHLSYTPKKVTKNTKHISLVGKGLTFDTGGYSLKPASSIANMKFDMAGSATVYGAFKAAVLLELPIKISCYLGMTDNAISSNAILPDSIVTARNGKTVEILNTDAEGRLVLGDVLDYACDESPNAIIDCATLTGAVLVSLGNEICGLLGNDKKLINGLLKSAKESDEYLWQLPIIESFHKDIQSNIADLKNIGGSRFGGTSKAAAFLSNFVNDDIAWAHLDIAGIGDSQSHLPYCPSKGASGLIIRTLVHYLKNV